ncbi:glycine--tRNA ligase subunit beta [Desulfogranum mediterraneum]|uniref:glycine--tRNA ligase subunit beta n=1 Tax=Desulfogranum mediterraneum TaxID=160661 RepID=UPI000416FA35|nr:glycine--tRNA ligase subunit beta [Desulfogranum mediterraneum]
MSELLFEIGTEEIPAGYIQPALTFLASEAEKKLQALGLNFRDVQTFGTPRRLTLAIGFVEERQPDRREEHVGPAKSAGFDADGNPTKAAMGFARSKGMEVSELQVVTTAKGEYLLAVEDLKGKETSGLLPGLLESLVKELVFPKSMHWADSAMTFARPIQWLVALYGGQQLAVRLEDILAGSTTRGHRFLAPKEIPVTGISQYLQVLEENYVVADLKKRRQMVVSQVEQAVRERAGIPGAQPVLHEGLIDTVTNLVERPHGICGSFDEKFLQLPDEALITSMREHQKYFPVADAEGRLLPRFVAVNNTDVADQELAANGHERVLRARLEDGLFFLTEDRKSKLSDRLPQLDGIIFQHKLGTMLAKSERMAQLAELLAQGLDPALTADAVCAARLAKADLLTEMVGEFPSLQGVMGCAYALNDGEKPEVAQAILEHYLPVRAGGSLPETRLGAIVGLADRLDTLAGCFAIGERPSGTKDAFGLRRQAIGLINIIRGLEIKLSLGDCIAAALANYGTTLDVPAGTAGEIIDFIRLRFENEQSSLGYPQEVVSAATGVGFDDIIDCLARMEALNTIRSQESFGVLAGSYKRIRNIIKENSATEVDASLLAGGSEAELYATLEQVREKALPQLAANNYTQALSVMLEMEAPLDRFFTEVMVMAEDLQVRQNRLNLLTGLGELVLRVGDISRMHGDDH